MMRQSAMRPSPAQQLFNDAVCRQPTEVRYLALDPEVRSSENIHVRAILFSASEQSQQVWLTGASGTGKSTLVQNIRQVTTRLPSA